MTKKFLKDEEKYVVRDYIKAQSKYNKLELSDDEVLAGLAQTYPHIHVTRHHVARIRKSLGLMHRKRKEHKQRPDTDTLSEILTVLKRIEARFNKTKKGEKSCN